MTWELEAEGIIPKHNFTGTIEEVVYYINNTFPAYMWADLPDMNNKKQLATTLEDFQRSRASADFTNGTMHCWRFKYCSWTAISQGVNYLYTVPGTPSANPAPNNCARVSCKLI